MADRRFERALVTGASSGIGRAMAEELAGRGTHLVLVARREQRLEEVAAHARDLGVGAEVLAADLTDDADLARVEERLRSDPPLDLLVNNAGASGTGRFHRRSAARAELQVDVNVRAVVRLTHAGLVGMRGRGRGAVLFTSSAAAFHPIPGMAVYAATKAFLLSFGESLHEELRGTGVTSTVLCPGFTDTEFIGEGSAIPDAILMDARRVAAAGIEGARRGRAVVTPGLAYKLHRGLSTVLPDSVFRWVAGRAV